MSLSFLSHFGFSNEDKVDDSLYLDCGSTSKDDYSKFLLDDTSSDSNDPLNLLHNIDQIFCETANSGGQDSVRTSLSDGLLSGTNELSDIDLDIIQEVLEKDVNSSRTMIDTLDSCSSSSDVEIEEQAKDVVVSNCDIEEDDVPYFDTHELHNYSCRLSDSVSGASCSSSPGALSPGGSMKEDIEPEEEEYFEMMNQEEESDEDEDSNSDLEDEDSNSSDGNKTKSKSILTKSNRGHNNKMVSDRGHPDRGSRKGSAIQMAKSGQKMTRRSATDRNLTEEEKRLLAKEGIKDFPRPGVPLSKQEEKLLRKIRRKIRNKKSAQCSRQRKKEYVEQLESKFENCNQENSLLKKEVLKLKKENHNLLMKMKNLITGKVTPVTTGTATTGNTSSTGQASFKTSFFVLFLSFFLVLIPFFNPDSLEHDSNLLLNSDSSVLKEGSIGRHLLAAYNSSPSSSSSESKFPASFFLNKMDVASLSPSSPSSSAINSSSSSSSKLIEHNSNPIPVYTTNPNSPKDAPLLNHTRSPATYVQ